MRFGNKSFKTWLERVQQNADTMLEAIVPIKQAIPELKTYLVESFGQYERLDYGTGHEFNFFIFIYCLCKIGVF